MFLNVSVILFTGGSASVHAGMPPPRMTHHPGRHTLQEDTRKTAPPLQEDTPPGAVHAGRYREPIGGTHRTGMHTICSDNIFGEKLHLN